MKRTYFALISFLTFAALHFCAQAVELKSNAAGQELAAELRNAPPEEASQITGILKIRGPSKKIDIPVRAQVVMEGDKWKTIYTTKGTSNAPAFQVFVIHATNSPNQYFFAQAKDNMAPAPEPASLLNTDAQNISLAGSDFSLADLGLDFLHWPEQIRLTGELRLGRDCYLLESRNSKAGEMVRVKSWIDKESNGVLVAEGYNAKNELVKKFSLSGSSFKKVKGRWQLEKMTIYSPKKKSETVLQFDLAKD